MVAVMRRPRRVPLSWQGAGQYPPTVQIRTLPPPVGGWNTRDTLPTMKATDAPILDNWIPDTGAVRFRPGFSQHATGLAGLFVESLIEYAPPSGTNKLFGAATTVIYDVTASGAASAVVTTMTNARWQHALMTNTSGNYLTLCNGADTPRLYDGTTWSASGFTGSGLTTANLVHVVLHMNRLFFVEINTLNAWYGPTSAITGTLTKFLPPFKLGGYLNAIATWTRDGGSGPDDHLVFLSSKGECIVYIGTDLSSASTSALVGIFKIPEPIGRRCFLKVGGDLAVLTSQGVVPLSQVLATSEAGAANTAITDKISPSFRSAYIARGTAFGWQMIEYPKKNLLIANVPIAERTTQYQFVMNTRTGAWCRFTGMNFGCWGLNGDVLYGGGNDGKTYKFDTGYLDGSSNIIALMQSAYSTFGSPKTKRFLEARPLLLAPTGYNVPVAMQVDYDSSNPTVSIVAAATGGTQWDAGLWDTFQWAGGVTPTLNWQGVNGEGRAGSIAFGVSAQDEIVYNGCDVAFEPGAYH